MATLDQDDLDAIDALILARIGQPMYGANPIDLATLIGNTENIGDVASGLYTLSQNDPAQYFSGVAMTFESIDENGFTDSALIGNTPLTYEGMLCRLRSVDDEEAYRVLAHFDPQTGTSTFDAPAPFTPTALWVFGFWTRALNYVPSAIKEKTDTIGALAVTISSPLAADGTATITEGDSYPASKGRAFSFLIADPTHALGLDGSECSLWWRATEFNWQATSVTSTAAGYTVVFEPTAAHTALLTLDRQPYKIIACYDNVAPADDDATTLQSGEVVVTSDIPALLP
jgi:hypothetical protein